MTKLEPLYKILNDSIKLYIVDKQPPPLTENEKITIYNYIVKSINSNKKIIELYNYKNPYAIQNWLKHEHHLKCDIYQKEFINGPINGYGDSHYCIVYL